MKFINTSTRTLVDFPPNGEPIPIYFLYKGQRLKIDCIIEKKSTRRTFDNCILYKCLCRGSILELRWDRDKNRWYIEKLDSSVT